MPAFARDHQHLAILLRKAKRKQGLRLGFQQHRFFHGLPLAVEAIERFGDAARLLRVVREQQTRAKAASPMRPPALMRGPMR